MAEGPVDWASTSLQRSYSEHANLVLQHFRQHRRRAAAADVVKSSRSGPDFRVTATEEADDEADDYDDLEEDELATENGSRTWRIPSVTSEEPRPYRLDSRLGLLGAGDSGALSSDFSHLNLHDGKCGEIKTIEDEEEPLFGFLDDDESFSAAERLEFEEEQRPGEQSFAGRLNGQPLKRKISYEDWAREKKLELQRRREEAQRAERERREREEEERRKREENEKLESASIAEWMRRKEAEMLRRKLREKEIELSKKLQQVKEEDKSTKDQKLKEWYKKKEEQIKALEKEEMMKKKKAEEEKKRKFEKSSKAYEEWKKKSINTPRPATQGLLPHQKAKPAFTNPTPWQPLVDNPSDESDDASRPKVPNAPVKSKKYGIRR